MVRLFPLVAPRIVEGAGAPFSVSVVGVLFDEGASNGVDQGRDAALIVLDGGVLYCLVVGFIFWHVLVLFFHLI